MKTTHSESYANGETSSTEPKRPKPRNDAAEFLRRAKALLSELPSDLDARARHSPYAAIGIAAGVGFAAGVVMSSRILRAALATGIAYAATELGRGYLHDALGGLEQEIKSRAAARS